MDTTSPFAKLFDTYAESLQYPVRPEGGPLTVVAEESRGALDPHTGPSVTPVLG